VTTGYYREAAGVRLDAISQGILMGIVRDTGVTTTGQSVIPGLEEVK
jgi:hypothetical protein